MLVFWQQKQKKQNLLLDIPEADIHTMRLSPLRNCRDKSTTSFLNRPSQTSSHSGHDYFGTSSCITSQACMTKAGIQIIQDNEWFPVGDLLSNFTCCEDLEEFWNLISMFMLVEALEYFWGVGITDRSLRLCLCCWELRICSLFCVRGSWYRHGHLS